MGGKDPIVVDCDGDSDTAVEGVTVSPFGYPGQNCLACSRGIAVESVYDSFLRKLKKRVGEIAVGSADNLRTYRGPVINPRAKKSILADIEAGKKEGRLITGGEVLPRPGQSLAPTVIADVSPEAKIAQEETFGPVLAVIKARDFNDALKTANNTEYGPTGAVYTRDRRRLEEATDRFHVRNLYLNRKCTGALVGAHAYGGFNMSRTDSKAGGRDFLLLFTEAKTISEKAASV